MDFTIPAINLRAIGPELIITGFAFLVLLFDLIIAKTRKHYLAYIALIGIIIAALDTLATRGMNVSTFSDMIAIDSFANFFKFTFLVIAFITVLISMRYIQREGVNRGEYYELLLFATVGMMLMASSTDLMMIYLSLELMSLSIYVLAGFLPHHAKSSESAIKYFILGSFSSALYLFGTSIIYGYTGTTNLLVINEFIAQAPGESVIEFVALTVILVAFGFKIAAVPFHVWVPDVYEGAPTPITGFMSVGPKAAGFALLLRVLYEAFPVLEFEWQPILYGLCILTMTFGNVVAVVQKNVKRMLAYSSIAHAGYILMGIVVFNGRPITNGLPDGLTATLFYLFVYLFANLGCFAIVLYLGKEGICGDKLEDYRGLAFKSPVVAGAMTFLLLSLTGIPPTAGFVGKYFLFGAAVREGFIWLAIIGILNSVISLFYYMGVTMQMYMRDPDIDYEFLKSGHWYTGVTIATAMTFLLTVFPEYILNYAKEAIQILVS